MQPYNLSPDLSLVAAAERRFFTAKGAEAQDPATARPCGSSTSTCLSFATISLGLCFLFGIPGILQKLQGLLQGGPLSGGRPVRDQARSCGVKADACAQMIWLRFQLRTIASHQAG